MESSGLDGPRYSSLAGPLPVYARLHYLAPDTDRFAALMQRRSLAGLHFEPMPPLKVRDRYLDTERAALLAAGYALRLREQDGATLATLRALDGRGDGVSERFGPAKGNALPAGRVRTAVEVLVGSEALGPLLVLRQYRTPRAVYDGVRLVGVLSLDVVTDDSAGAPESWHEVEVEQARSGTPEDLRRLDAELREQALVPVLRSKFERALLRLGRAADGPLHLLPDERAALEALRSSGSSVERRRAEVILLAADGLPTRAVSYRASLSPSRVRHWKHAFRHERMQVFDMAEPERNAPTVPAEPLGFRVSELVERPAAGSAETLGSVLAVLIDSAHRHPGTPRITGDEPGPAERHGD